MTVTVKIAIVGGGLIAPRHAAAVHAHPVAELVALVELSPKGPETAAQFNTRLYTSVAELLAASNDTAIKPDAAIVCTPNHTHVSISRDLLAAGIHVLVEKPLSHTTETARALVQYTRENANVKLAVGHHRRFNPYMLKAKEIVSSGSLGSIMAVNGMWTLFKPDDYFQPPTDWRRLKDAGGVVLINLVHDVDLLQFLFGAIERVHVEKIARQRGDHHQADEGAALTLRFASGVVGSFLVCDATPSPYNFESGTGENVNIPAAPSKENFYHIFGSNASLSVPEMARWSYDGRPAKSWNQPLTVDKFEVDSSAVPYDGQLAAFLDYIAGKESASCSAVEGLQALLVCDAVRKALDGNQTVDVELA